MTSITKLHHKSLEFSDEAILAKRKGDKEVEKILYEKAFWLEKQAAILMGKNDNIPFPRLVMIRSAAALAYKAGMYQEALKMIAFGYKEYPAAAAKEELEPVFIAVKEKVPNITKKTQYLTGIVTGADSKEYQIKLETLQNSHPYFIMVAPDMLDEIVRAYWKNQVLVEITSYAEGVMVLNKIRAAA